MVLAGLGMRAAPIHAGIRSVLGLIGYWLPSPQHDQQHTQDDQDGPEHATLADGSPECNDAHQQEHDHMGQLIATPGPKALAVWE